MVLNRIANTVWWYIQTGKTVKGDFGGNQTHLHDNNTLPAVRALVKLEKKKKTTKNTQDSITPAPLPLIYIECHPHLSPVPDCLSVRKNNVQVLTVEEYSPCILSPGITSEFFILQRGTISLHRQYVLLWLECAFRARKTYCKSVGWVGIPLLN